MSQRWRGLVVVSVLGSVSGCVPFPEWEIVEDDGGDAAVVADSDAEAAEAASTDAPVEADAGPMPTNPCPSPNYSCCGDLYCMNLCIPEICDICAGLGCDKETQYCCYVGGTNPPTCKAFDQPCGM